MKFIKGNLLESEAEALVNTVNTMGVMGKGIALQFKERFPENFRAYAKACKSGEVRVGRMFVYDELTTKGKKTIVNFPTKEHWYRKSQYRFIEEGLEDLVKVIQTKNIKSIALPPLGAGNGGLKWNKVKELMTQYLSSLDSVEIIIYEPNKEIKKLLQKESAKKNVKLTPARAMLLYALFKYEKFGEYSTVFTANKIMYFLQQSGENLRLKFEPYTYGPYAQAVEKVLYALNGNYLTGLEQMQAGPFEQLKLNYSKLDEVKEYVNKNLEASQRQRLDDLFRVIDGFESTFSLEILSSVHYLKKNTPKLTREEVLNKIREWNDRKKALINEYHVDLAYEQLENYGRQLQIY
ncbi:type II toxin-antitoxin system antitoxin DNA ADP-ribosyl glycohydrolase DarG [Tunicatimonas pelagia]|uniref:type II toxin-antitoxin system antitoxin DNA ADP-ribosyl glycohydrolase DarG n=1 Tax=Tunicatimonas pelagia TaxID=931531 RepID=UPI0026650176|nr:macro domain-containing protein [Tunicatimonas pelagia]WKN46225.1 macro domain-containing protein [Tunicatimonas pelagia]